MPVRILHLADLHLGARCELWGDRAEERRQELEQTFVRAIDRALAEETRAQAVILAGDLFDTHRPSARLASFAKGQIERLTQAGIAVVAVPGTHDSLEYPDSIFRDPMPDGMYVFSDPNVSAPHTLTLGGELVHFYGMAYLPGRSTPRFDEFRRTTDAGYHVAILHGSLEGSPAWEMKARYVPLSLERLGETGMHYVALGHYHEFRRSEANGVQVVYPGTIESTAFAGTGNRYLTWVELAEGKAQVHHMSSDLQPINSKVMDVRTIDLSVSSAASEDELAAQIREWADPRLVLQVRLEGTAEFSLDVDALVARLEPHFSLIKIRDDVRYYDSQLVEQLAKEETVPGMFVRRLRGRIESASTSEERSRAELALKLGMSEFLRE